MSGLRRLVRGRGKALSNLGMILGMLLTMRGLWWGLAMVILSAVLRPLGGQLKRLVSQAFAGEGLRGLPDGALDLWEALAYYGEKRWLTLAALAQEATERADERVGPGALATLLELRGCGLVDELRPPNAVDHRLSEWQAKPELAATVAAERERRLRVAPPKKRSRLSPLAKRAAI